MLLVSTGRTCTMAGTCGTTPCAELGLVARWQRDEYTGCASSKSSRRGSAPAPGGLAVPQPGAPQKGARQLQLSIGSAAGLICTCTSAAHQELREAASVQAGQCVGLCTDRRQGQPVCASRVHRKAAVCSTYHLPDEVLQHEGIRPLASTEKAGNGRTAPSMT